MKNLIQFAALFISILFATTSCQKEDFNDFQDVNPTQTERQATNSKTVNDDVITYAKADIVEKLVTERATHIEIITCNTGTIQRTTEGAGSTFNSNNAPCVSPDGDNFKGDDNIFYFIVENQPEAITTHHFELKDMNDDLDLFLYALTPTGRVNECKATSITIGLDNESIDVQGLNAGAYILVVDGWNEDVSSSYTLDVYCSAISSNPPSIDFIDAINNISFGYKYSDGSSSDKGKLYVENDQWKEHIWGLPHFDTFENDALLVEYERGETYLILEAQDGRYFEIQFEEEKIYVYDAGFNEIEALDILLID
ncbi:MAG: hypothetical protein AB8G22_09360 [Saprospiraceae bacterium]